MEKRTRKRFQKRYVAMRVVIRERKDGDDVDSSPRHSGHLLAFSAACTNHSYMQSKCATCRLWRNHHRNRQTDER
jgi:hypothetical protein